MRRVTFPRRVKFRGIRKVGGSVSEKFPGSERGKLGELG